MAPVTGIKGISSYDYHSADDSGGEVMDASNSSEAEPRALFTENTLNIFGISSSLFLPLALFRGLTPFTVYIAEHFHWTFMEAASYNAFAEFGILLIPFVIVGFKTQTMRSNATGLLLGSSFLIIAGSIPSFVGQQIILCIARFGSGLFIGLMLLAIMRTLERMHVNRPDQQMGWNAIHGVWAMSSIAYIFIGQIWQRYGFQMIFPVFAFLQLPWIVSLCISIPSTYEEDYDPDLGLPWLSQYKELFFGMFLVMKEQRRFLLCIAVCISAMCFNLFLSGLGTNYNRVHHLNAAETGKAFSFLFLGGLFGFTIVTGTRASWGSLALCTVGTTLILIAFTVHTVVTNTAFTVSLLLTFFVGIAIEMVYPSSIYLMTEYCTVPRMKYISVLVVMVWYSIGAAMGVLISPILWNQGGWPQIVFVLSVLSACTTLTFVVLGCAPGEKIQSDSTHDSHGRRRRRNNEQRSLLTRR